MELDVKIEAQNTIEDGVLEITYKIRSGKNYNLAILPYLKEFVEINTNRIRMIE